eukprot:TRINITY_DN1616_c1_g1_i1.p1 TRINITY_DN1616_c1_g1~~TRINITY_DN1616_c1_g1_i1.p1  ORF type:complete len:321 (+),score=67.71 TRINITY_DN1616_c1_g1_i1:62-964(+)
MAEEHQHQHHQHQHQHQQPMYRLTEIGPGLWNARAPFKLFKGLVDICTHMGVIRLASGRFLILDGVELKPELAAELDQLTDNGRLVEAVLATHPFHTMYIGHVHAKYPNAQYYGCPRHLRRLTQIQWAGDLNDPCVRKRWEPEVFMRIPAGSEFVNPLPEDKNHFSNVFVFHPPSRSIYNNDTIMYSTSPGFLLRLGGFKDGTMMFHVSLKGPGLLPHPEAPLQFRDWVEGICRDWDFDTILSAHNSNRIGGAKRMLLECLQKATPTLLKLADKRKRNEHIVGPVPPPVPPDEEHTIACG